MSGLGQDRTCSRSGQTSAKQKIAASPVRGRLGTFRLRPRQDSQPARSEIDYGPSKPGQGLSDHSAKEWLAEGPFRPWSGQDLQRARLELGQARIHSGPGQSLTRDRDLSQDSTRRRTNRDCWTSGLRPVFPSGPTSSTLPLLKTFLHLCL